MLDLFLHFTTVTQYKPAKSKLTLSDNWLFTSPFESQAGDDWTVKNASSQTADKLTVFGPHMNYSFLRGKRDSISNYFIFLSSASISPVSFVFWGRVGVFL